MTRWIAAPASPRRAALRKSFEFDKAGNPTLHVDANGVAVTRTFDKISRETLKTYSAGSDGLTGIATGYDANGNPLTITESYASGPARVTSHEYDAFDRPTSSQDGYGAKMVFSYDKNGNRTILATQDAKQTRYGYDGLNRLTGLNSPAGGVQYVYDRSGLTLQQIWSNGTATESRYDAARRPLRITLSKGSTALNLTEYLYDKNGNRLEERINRPHAANGAQLATYRCDAADRLEGTTLRRGADSVETTWSYDRADNRLSEKVVSRGATNSTVERSYSYDARNQLRSIADSAAGTITLSYDAQGNLTQKAKGGDTTTYAWNARDLLSNVSRNGTVLGNYSGDHAGLRVGKEAMNPLQPGAPRACCARSGRAKRTAGSRRGRCCADALRLRPGPAGGAGGAPRTASNCCMPTRWAPSWPPRPPMAASRARPCTTPGAIPSSGRARALTSFAYTGHQADPDTGLYYFKARYYDPELGRFISEDPADGRDGKPASYHRYLYAYGNPLVYVDPDGETSKEALGLDDAGIEQSMRSDSVVWGATKYAAKSTFYEVWNFASGGFVKRHDARLELRDSGQITQERYEKSPLVLDATVSVVANLAGGAVGRKGGRRRRWPGRRQRGGPRGDRDGDGWPPWAARSMPSSRPVRLLNIT
ncbi:hypothetical protein PEC18_03410 [Paucibacter sp. O1-1]|nr:hypothetical protein [Paucibacter sp. O1-1]MDA3824925.1 hypothetical protein [Paucibacter sp. O1-1]